MSDVMSVDAIYAVMRGAGFPPHVAVTMTAIALRESGGNPKAFNGNEKTGDRSYGLLQINMLDKNVAKLMEAHGISEQALTDPEANARAGFLLWSGRTHNLDLAWYINRAGPYKIRYESHLPEAQAAALRA
jgi:hypothetical protein